MKSLEYIKEHYDEFEEDKYLDRRWTKRFLDFLPVKEWINYGFAPSEGADPPVVKEWTEDNILKQLKEDVEFGYQKAIDERGISSELMAMVVNTWCKVLENGLNLDGNDGRYCIQQFTVVAEHYGWKLEGGCDEES